MEMMDDDEHETQEESGNGKQSFDYGMRADDPNKHTEKTNEGDNRTRCTYEHDAGSVGPHTAQRMTTNKTRHNHDGI